MTAIRLVISDCDGTLVTPDKVLTEATLKAVKRLDEAGIGFAVTSSRPPLGMRMLVAPLGLKLPLGPFNGSTIIAPDLQVIEQHLIPAGAAEGALAVLEHYGIDAWLFTSDAWMLVNADGDYVDHERSTVKLDPTAVKSLAPYAKSACKIVGASADFDTLARCEAAMRDVLGERAHAARSQSYYLDVTPPGQDKGRFADAMAARTGVSLQEIATLGDMANDVAMFARSGVSFAMGNAPDDVKARATHVTASNTDEGFAKAIAMMLDGGI